MPHNGFEVAQTLSSVEDMIQMVADAFKIEVCLGHSPPQ